MPGALPELRKTYAYLSATRKAYLDALDRVPWDAVARERGPGRASLRNALVDALDAHRWAFACLLGLQSAVTRASIPEEYGAVEDLRRAEAEVDALAMGVLDGLREADLAREHEVEPGLTRAAEAILRDAFAREAACREEMRRFLGEESVAVVVVSFEAWSAQNPPPHAA